MLTGIALFSVILITKDKIKAQAANKVYLNNENMTLELGRYSSLKVKGTKESVIWKSANNRAATVNSKGKVTARGWGSTKIYASVGNKTLSSKITIVQMNKKNVALTSGKTTQLTLWGSNNSTTWESSNNKVATVSDNGLVTAVGQGTATITALFNGKKITSKITVVGLNHDSFVLEYGGRFIANVPPNYGSTMILSVTGTKDKITWSSSNTKVATVNSNGKVTAKGPGTAKITANLNGSIITSDVKVLQMDFCEITLSKGENFALNVLGTNSDIYWFSTKNSVATVSDEGVVTAKKPGTAKVIAEVDGMMIRSIVTVK
jgi:chitinase